MAPSNPRHTYEVHLDDDVASALDVASPVETTHIDYYDSGLWVALEAGRDFYPYHHVLTIKERPVEVGEATDAAGEARTAVSGPAEPMD